VGARVEHVLARRAAAFDGWELAAFVSAQSVDEAEVAGIAIGRFLEGLGLVLVACEVHINAELLAHWMGPAP